ncbi:MAG: rhomboid family intramembrane serine protease [Actinobacteria bacterium]|nr:rhomboid family intramembrane serine protease [Actinomycetota bacterium]
MSETEPESRGTSRSGLIAVLVMLGIMWGIEVIDLILPWDFEQYGISSRDVSGLVGVPLAPFLHVDFGHLLANTLPFLVLGLLVAWRAGRYFWQIFATIVIVGGLGVWLLGPSLTVTVGASGVVFGFLAYLLVAGVLTRHWLDVLLAIAVFLLYGSLLVGALPWGVSAGVSWLGHLCGALAGGLAAFWFARRATGDRVRTAIE